MGATYNWPADRRFENLGQSKLLVLLNDGSVAASERGGAYVEANVVFSKNESGDITGMSISVPDERSRRVIRGVNLIPHQTRVIDVSEKFNSWEGDNNGEFLPAAMLYAHRISATHIYTGRAIGPGTEAEVSKNTDRYANFFTVSGIDRSMRS